MARDSIITVDTARTLAHIGLLAAWEGDCDAADSIFMALQSIKPKEPNIPICRAMVLACQGKHDDACALLNEVLDTHPDNINAKCLLGYVLCIMGERNWQALLEEVVADGSDPSSVELAKEILEENGEKSTRKDGIGARSQAFTPYA